MQKAIVELVQGVWGRIARVLDFDKKRLQKTALRQEFARGSEGKVALDEDACRRNTG